MRPISVQTNAEGRRITKGGVTLDLLMLDLFPSSDDHSGMLASVSNLRT